MSRDSEGHRTYKLTCMVECDSKNDGPFTAIQAPGLPAIGSTWAFGNDIDLWAYCLPDMEVTQVHKAGPNKFFLIQYTFSTKPPDRQRCQDTQIQDPLLEPPGLSGNFVKYTEEATHDRFGLPIINSAFEQIRGPQVEFDANRMQIKIEMNVWPLNLPLIASMMDTVNKYPLWGLPPRTIKLSNAPWTRKFKGVCQEYFTRTLEFDINLRTFDRTLLDEATKVLNGHWHPVTGEWILDNINGKPPNPSNPKHFIRLTDRQGNPVKGVLDGFGEPYDEDCECTSSTGTGAGGECDSCTDCTPRVWRVTGFGAATESDPKWNLLLAHAGGCAWEASVNNNAADGTMTLELIAGVWTLATNSLGGIWTLDAASFDCSGFNVLTNGTDEGPAEVYVSCASSNEPGQFYLQKYQESDFLLLGIPVAF